MKTTLMVFLATIMFGNYSFAQNRVSAHLGLGVPLGEFAEGSEYFGFIKNESYAGTGLSLGLTYQYQLGTSDLHAFGDFSIYRNALRLRHRRDYAEWANENLKINHSEYYNIPLAVGLLYQKSFDDHIALYVKGGALLNFLKISKTRIVTSYDVGDAITERRYPISTSLGATGEVGVIINDRYSIGLGLTRFGRFRFEQIQTKIDTDGEEQISRTEDVKNISMFNLKVGYRF